MHQNSRRTYKARKIDKEDQMTGLARYLFGFNEGGTIQTRPIDGDNWYMAADICRLLDKEGQHSQLVQTHLEDYEFQKKTIYIGGYGKRKVLLVNTTGMLKLIGCGKAAYAQQVQERLTRTPDRLKTVNWPETVTELAA